MPYLPLGVCILAGGESRRMGEDKAFASLGGKILLAWALEKAFPLALPVVVASGRRIIPQVECVLDTKGQGPMAGVYAALGRFFRVLVFPVDMPFLTTEFLAFLLERGSRVDLLVCKVGGHVHPQVGVYSGRCKSFIEERLDRGQWALKGLLEDPLEKEVLEEEEIAPWGNLDRLFFNVNTPESLERAGEMLRRD